VSVRMSKVSEGATVEFGAVDGCAYRSRHAAYMPAVGTRVVVPVWDNGDVVGHGYGVVSEHLPYFSNMLVTLEGGDTVLYYTYSVVLAS
jgi:hypothetical protein